MKFRILMSLAAILVFFGLYLVGINGKHSDQEQPAQDPNSSSSSQSPSQSDSGTSSGSFSGIGK